MDSNTNVPSSHQGNDRPSPKARDADPATAQRIGDASADPAQPAVQRMAANAHQAVDKVAALATRAVDSLDVKGGQIKGAQGKALTDARIYVQEHPLAALGMALAAGYALSRLLSGR